VPKRYYDKKRPKGQTSALDNEAPEKEKGEDRPLFANEDPSSARPLLPGEEQLMIGKGRKRRDPQEYQRLSPFATEHCLAIDYDFDYAALACQAAEQYCALAELWPEPGSENDTATGKARWWVQINWKHPPRPSSKEVFPDANDKKKE